MQVKSIAECSKGSILQYVRPSLTLKAPITTAADDKFSDLFPNFRQKLGMILHENRLLARLPADDSHEISCLICYFEKVAKF